LDEVEEEHSAAGIALGKGHDEAQVGLEEVVLCVAAVVGDPLEFTARLGRHLVARAQLLFGEQASLDALGEIDLLVGIEERDLTALLELVLDGVCGGACRHHLLDGGVVFLARDHKTGDVLVDFLGFLFIAILGNDDQVDVDVGDVIARLYRVGFDGRRTSLVRCGTLGCRLARTRWLRRGRVL
jgi:hypothetical protein